MDALVELALAIFDAGGCELELDAALQPVAVRGRVVQRLEPAAVPVERLRIAAETLVAESPPCASGATARARPLPAHARGDTHPGLLVPRRELADVPERLGDVRHLERWQLEVLGRGERPLEELGGVDVREPVLRQLADGDGVAPGPLVVLRVQKVEREQGRELDGALTGARIPAPCRPARGSRAGGGRRAPRTRPCGRDRAGTAARSSPPRPRTPRAGASGRGRRRPRARPPARPPGGRARSGRRGRKRSAGEIDRRARACRSAS